MFCKGINRTQPAIEIWVRAFEERDERLIHATKFIFNNNNNKQDFTPNGINNKLEEFTKRVQGRVQGVIWSKVCCEGCKVL